jgi:hypothetical protein
MQDISLQHPTSDSLQSLAINSLQPHASHSLQSLAANSLRHPASLAAESLQPTASNSLQSLAINSLQPPASHSLQSLTANSLQPPASHSLQSLAIKCRQSPDGQSLQTPVVNSFLVGLGCLSPTFARTGTPSASRGSLERASGTGTAEPRLISMPPATPEVKSFSGAPSIRSPEATPASNAFDPVFSTGTPGDSLVSYAPVFPTGVPVANPDRASGTGAPSAAAGRNNSDVWSSTTDGKPNYEPDHQHGPPATYQTPQTSCSDGVLTIAIGQADGGGGVSDEGATRTSKGGAGFVVHTDSFFGRDLSRLKIALSNHRDVIRPRNVKKRSRKL